MKSFSTFINEALITFGKKAYPKFGQVVIMAGGAGSGKGFILEKLVGIEGKVLDVDAVKGLAMASIKLAAKIKAETGQDITKFDLKKPENVSTIHTLLSDIYGLIGKNERKVFAGIAQAAPDRKPNLIFDVTLKEIDKLKKITGQAQDLGYKKENIHIVWVMNDVKVAMKQNATRDRVVPEKILVSTHVGATTTMGEILNKGNALRSMMDGDIWIAFNKKASDAVAKAAFAKSKKEKNRITTISKDQEDGGDATVRISKDGGFAIVDANYFKVKEKGKASKSVSQLETEVLSKVKSYAPAKSEFE